MKSAQILKVSLITLLGISFAIPCFANDLDSTNYKIVGATTTTGGGLGDSVSGDYSILSSLGKISADPRNYSTNYILNQDPSENFVASVPQIRCFETTTDGSTNCTTGPSELLSGGMVAICGGDGCYDKARFEIESSNPDDTLYSVAISDDNFVANVQYIDGATFKPEDVANHDINDFRTISYWETEVFNIQGLVPDTTYYIKIDALHGDFTQSDYSPVSSATTAIGTISFDIDIATSSGQSDESSPPYSISFSGSQDLVAGAAATKATNLIWLDIQSSATGGVSVIQYGKNGGLYSPTTLQTITSANADLDATTEGFGLQSYYIDYDTSTYFGDLTATTNYSGSINTVGEVSTSANKIYQGDGPIQNGRTGIYLIARAGTDKTPATDYSEEIYFVLVPLY